MPFMKFQGHMRQKSQISTQIERVRTVAPGRINEWLLNDAQRLE